MMPARRTPTQTQGRGAPAGLVLQRQPTKPAGQEPDVEPFTDAQLERMGQVAQVNVLFTQVQALKNDRVKTWTDTATATEPKPLQYALDLVVAMVALGMGGVLGMLVSKGIKGEYLKDFVYLAGLEFTDKLAV